VTAAASDEVRRRIARVVHSFEATSKGRGILKPRSAYLESVFPKNEPEVALLVIWVD
jgi:hypothetical protein